MSITPTPRIPAAFLQANIAEPTTPQEIREPLLVLSYGRFPSTAQVYREKEGALTVTKVISQTGELLECYTQIKREKPWTSGSWKRCKWVRSQNDGTAVRLVIKPRELSVRDSIFKGYLNAEKIQNILADVKEIVHSELVTVSTNKRNELVLSLFQKRYHLGDLMEVLINESLTLTKKQIYTIARSAIYAVFRMHEKQIIHADIKPENILVDGAVASPGELTVAITDLDFSALVEEPTYEMGGTTLYLSPETCRKRLDNQEKNFSSLLFSLEERKASDVWALGITLYCLAERSFPSIFQEYTFSEEHRRGFVRMMGTYRSRSKSLVPWSRDPLKKLIRNMLYLNPSERPNMKEVWDAFQSIDCSESQN